MTIGTYTRYLSNPAEEDAFNQRVQGFLDGNIGDGPQNAPAEEVRAWADHFQKADVKLNARNQSADAFVALHPEFLDTQENGQAMNRTLLTLYGDVAFTPGQFEQAYAVLRANNALDLDQALLVQREQAAADERAKAAREQRAKETRVYTEDERYAWTWTS